MIYEIRNNLTTMNCSAALTLATQLFESQYSNNEIRMLYASAHGCNVNIQLYPLIDALSVADLSTPDAIFKTAVRLFPSRSALDSKLQSTWYMQDILQSILRTGTVIAASDQVVVNAYNTGSLLYRDRTDDGNAFLVFSSMAGLGTALNRYGFNVADDPAALAYAQQVNLAATWASGAAVKADITHAGCSMISSMLNMFDAIDAVSALGSGGVFAALTQINAIKTNMQNAGMAQCLADFAGANVQCANAAARLRYRDACFEATVDDYASSYAFGIIQAIDAGWL